MKKMLLLGMLFSLQLGAMQNALQPLAPVAEAAKIAAVGSVATFGYMLMHSAAKSVWIPELYAIGYYDQVIQEYGISEPDTWVKQLYRQAHTPTKRALLYTANHKYFKTILATNLLVAAAAQMPGIGGAPLSLSDVKKPIGVCIGISAAASFLTAIISRAITERNRMCYFPRGTFDEFKARIGLPNDLSDRKVSRYLAALYSDWANRFVGIGASVAVAAYLIALRNR